MDALASTTIDELERRFKELRYMVAGYHDADDLLRQAQQGGAQQTITARVAALEQALGRQRKRSTAAEDVLTLGRCGARRRGSLVAQTLTPSHSQQPP